MVLQPVLVEKLWQDGPDFRLRLLALDPISLAVYTIPYRLAEKSMCLLVACHIEQSPGAPGKDHTMNVHFILNGKLKMVKRFTGGLLRQRRKNAFSSWLIRSARRFAQDLPARAIL